MGKGWFASLLAVVCLCAGIPGGQAGMPAQASHNASTTAAQSVHNATAAQPPSWFNVAIIENPSAPMACRSPDRCWPTSRGWTRSDCPFNGIRTVSGVCVHGIIVDLLNIISDASSGQIRWRITLLSDPLHREDYDIAVMEATRPGKRWATLTGSEHMCDGQHCHLLASDITITSDRRLRLGAQFSAPFHENSLRLLMRYRNSWLNTATFALQPFSFSLWMAWFALMLGAAIVSVLLGNNDIRRAIVPAWLRNGMIRAPPEAGAAQINAGDAVRPPSPPRAPSPTLL